MAGSSAGPTQAVILAGGRGLRMRPLTDSRPKPMLDVRGRPFLAYLLDDLREQGIRHVLLLLGYLPHVVIDYFGDGRRLGLEIGYSVSPETDDTGARMRAAASKLDDTFLFMYGDNYWPLRLPDMVRAYRRSGLEAQITVYSNTDRYSRSNLRTAGGRVVRYDRSRLAEDLNGIDIGYGIMRKSVLWHLREGNRCFESDVFPSLIEERQLGAYRTDDRYYGVGSFERLRLTEDFFGRRRAALDAAAC